MVIKPLLAVIVAAAALMTTTQGAHLRRSSARMFRPTGWSTPVQQRDRLPERLTVTLPDRPRPSDGDLWAYYDSYVEITYLSGSSYVLAAHSWPDNGLAGAAIPVAAMGRRRAGSPGSSDP